MRNSQFLKTIIFSLMILSLSFSTAGAVDSLLINYQGHLTDSDGLPITDALQMTFTIYDGESVLQWSETHASVQVVNGLFNVVLGSVSKLDNSVFANPELYLGINVGSTREEILPRTLLTSSPTAGYAGGMTGDISSAYGVLAMNNINGDSAIVMNSGLEDNTARIYMIDPDENGKLFEIYGNHAFNEVGMSLIDPAENDNVLSLATLPDGGASFKMFNPQPEPPALLFDINASASTGTSLNIYDEIGQVMGVEPSPFNEAYSLKFIDPGDDKNRIVITSNHVTDVSSFKLIEPGNDGVTPAIEMTSGPTGSYFNVNGYDQGLSMSHNAFSVDVDNVDLVTNVKMIEPGNDIAPGFQFIADGMTDLANFKMLDPDNHNNAIVEMSGGSSGGSLKMFNPQPEPPALLFDVTADATNGANMAFYNSTGAIMTAGPNMTGGFTIKMNDEEEEPVQQHVELGSSFSIPAGNSRANVGGYLSLYNPVDFLETHLLPGEMTMQYNTGAMVGPPLYMYADANYARIGVGVSAPSEAIVIGKDLGSYTGEMLVVGNDESGKYSGVKLGEDSNNNGNMIWSNDNDYLYFTTKVLGVGATPLVLDGWNVGIGTSNPSQELHVAGDICYTGTLGACSDKRYKTDISRLKNPLDKISQLEGVSFKWKTDEYPYQKFSNGNQIGLIAQDVLDVVPEVVSKDDNDYLSVDYSKLTPLLIEAIKELKAENESLKKRLKQIEEKL